MSDYDTARPYAASYLIIRREGKIAFLLRTNTGWMDDNYGLPAGKVEKHESFTEAIIRESKEEIGIDVEAEDLKPIHISQRVTDGEMGEWVDVFFEASIYEGEPYNAEPNMHGKLVWLDPTNLPDNTILYIKHALKQIEAGNFYSEYRRSP